MASAPVTGAQPCYCLQVVRCGSLVHGITVFSCLFCLLPRHPDSVQRLRARQCQCHCQSDIYIAPKVEGLNLGSKSNLTSDQS